MTPGPEPLATATSGPEGAVPGASDPESAAVAARCSACGEALLDGASFCEACGARAGVAPPIGPGAGAGAGAAPGSPGEVAAPPGAPATAAGAPEVVCASCGGAVGSDGYCTTCGHRALEPVTVDDRGMFAYATHRGRRHHRNEDSTALAATSEGWPVLVVSDGVSGSPNPHLASAGAVAAAAGRLGGRPFAGTDDLVAAVADAHEAASAAPPDGDPHWTADGSHPACTIVVAVATDTAVHVANVGDARAHLLTPSGQGWAASQVTTDDSVAAQAVAQGIDVGLALNLPGGHGITAWLGADAPTLAPHAATQPAAPGAMLLVCSDGLWNYAPSDEAMSDLVTATLPPPGAPAEPPAGPCERLVSWANDQGGADNIAVALTPLPPPPPPDPGGAQPTELEDNA